MDNKSSKSSELHGAAAASHEKAQQDKSGAAKDQSKAKTSGTAKSSANSAGKSSGNKSR